MGMVMCLGFGVAFLKSQFLFGGAKEHFDAPALGIGLQYVFRYIVAIADQQVCAFLSSRIFSLFRLNRAQFRDELIFLQSHGNNSSHRNKVLLGHLLSFPIHREVWTLHVDARNGNGTEAGRRLTCQFLKDFTDQHDWSQRHVTFPTGAGSMTLRNKAVLRLALVTQSKLFYSMNVKKYLHRYQRSMATHNRHVIIG